MNEVTEQSRRSRFHWLRVLVNFLACLAILVSAFYAVWVINQNEPTAQKINTTRKSSALVETITVQRGTYSPRLTVLGTVEPAQRIRLSPRVNGQVTEVSPEFAPGGMIREGDLLLRIDPTDFENALSISQSELAQAKASMEIEEARQRQAEKELKLLEGSIDETNRGLVRREPQIASIKAEVSAADAAVQRAELNLSRTSIYAPFDAQVLGRSVNIGSQVGLGDELGQLIGLEEYWIMAAVPVRHLRWVEFATSSNEDDTTGDYSPGSRAILRDPDGWGKDVEREARVARMIGALDQETRLARVLLTVPDPLGIESGAPPLILDTLIETEIHGKPIDDVVRLEREFVRDQDTVWVMKDEKLEIRQTEIEFRDATYAYIRSGLEDGDEVVTTTLATVAAGIGLRKIHKSDQDQDLDSSSAMQEAGAE